MLDIRRTELADPITNFFAQCRRIVESKLVVGHRILRRRACRVRQRRNEMIGQIIEIEYMKETGEGLAVEVESRTR